MWIRKASTNLLQIFFLLLLCDQVISKRIQGPDNILHGIYTHTNGLIDTSTQGPHPMNISFAWSAKNNDSRILKKLFLLVLKVFLSL